MKTETKRIISIVIIALMIMVSQTQVYEVFAAPGNANITVGSSVDYPATAEGLNKAIQDIADGGTITLASDISAENPIYIFGTSAYVRLPQFVNQKIDKSFTVDGAGHTITANYDTTQITSSTNPSYATAGQDDWGMQGVLSIAEYGGEVTFKNLTANANNRTSLGIWVYRTGDGVHPVAANGKVVLDGVTSKNGVALYGKGGYGVQVNASDVKAINPVSEDNQYYGFNVDIGKSIDPNAVSNLEIVGVSTYNEKNQLMPSTGADGYGKYVNIVTEQKPNITIIDNGVSYLTSDYIPSLSSTIGVFSPAVLSPDTLPATDLEYTEYLPQTLDSHQYDVHYFYDGFYPLWYKTMIIFGIKPVKIKADEFKIEQTTKYNWNLIKEGEILDEDTLRYNVKAIAKDKKDTYKLRGNIYSKNFRADSSKPVTISAKLVNDNGDVLRASIPVFNLDADEEKILEIEFDLTGVNQGIDDHAHVEVSVQEEMQVDRLIAVPIDPTVVVKEINKTVTVVDSEYTFNPAFAATWEENGVYEKTYTLPAISTNFTNIASIALEDGTKLEKQVTLSPIPTKKKNMELDKGVDTGDNTLPLDGIGLLSLLIVVGVYRKAWK